MTLASPSRDTGATPNAAVERPHARHDRLHPGRIVLSEWTKLRSVRSTWWTLAATVAMMTGFGALLSAAFVRRFDRLDAGEKLRFDATVHSLRGIFLAQLAIGVLGVLTVTNEYATGMIRNTFAAVPQRRAVLAAKAAVFGAASLIVCEVAAFVTFFVGQAILSQKHLQASISDPGVLRAVIGAGLYLTGVGLLGIALGALLRRTAGAIATLFGLVLVLPILAAALPSPWNTDVSKVLPGGAGQAILNVRHVTDSLSPGLGFALFCVYIVAAGAVAMVVITRRDA